MNQAARPELLLREALDEVLPLLLGLTEATACTPRAEGAWSAKQVVGHLIDSASNNHQRFVRARFTDDLVFPGYDGDQWVDHQGYAEAPWESLVTLFYEFNQHIARVMERTSDEVLNRDRTRHNLHQIAWKTVPETEPASLGYFMRDYVGHLRHHANQIFPQVQVAR